MTEHGASFPASDEAIAAGEACCVCGASDARPWRRASDNLLGTPEIYTAVRCVRCGTVRLFPRPSPEEMVRHYTPLTYARAEGEAGTSELGKRLDAIFAHQADRLRAALPDFDKGGRLLDVGCGDGRFLAAMAARGWGESAFGIETDPIAADLARRRSGATIYETTLEDAPISASSFDLVSFLHVLEHVPNPRTVLAKAWEALRPGGALLIAVPNAGSLESKVFGSSWYHLDLPRHLWGFTPGSLSRLIKESGFTIRDTRYLPLLFAPQSARNVLRRKRAGDLSVAAEPSLPPDRNEESRSLTTIFLRLLTLSEKFGKVVPGEIMEFVAIKEERP